MSSVDKQFALIFSSWSGFCSENAGGSRAGNFEAVKVVYSSPDFFSRLEIANNDQTIITIRPA